VFSTTIAIVEKMHEHKFGLAWWDWDGENIMGMRWGLGQWW